MNKFIHLVRLGWAYKITRRTTLSYPPYQFTVEPTNACNLSCDFCPQSDPDHFKFRPVGRLTIENFKLFLERVAEAGSGNRNINLTLDGEPFINKDFLSFVELAIQAKMFPIFASNGTLLDNEKADRLSAAGPFRASIDFASDREIFETMRGHKGDYDLVYNNLTYLIKQAETNRGVHLDIHDITSYAGVDPEQSLDKMRSLFPLHLSPRIRFDSRQFHNFCGHLEVGERKQQYRLCPYPWTQMAVTYNGDCVPCCRDTTGRSVLGNVFTDPVMIIWNNEKYRQFRQNLLDRRPDLNAACKNCDLPYSGDKSRWKLKYIAHSLLKR